jgi:hypothetical protein
MVEWLRSSVSSSISVVARTTTVSVSGQFIILLFLVGKADDFSSLSGTGSTPAPSTSSTAFRA